MATGRLKFWPAVAAEFFRQQLLMGASHPVMSNQEVNDEQLPAAPAHDEGEEEEVTLLFLELIFSALTGYHYYIILDYVKQIFLIAASLSAKDDMMHEDSLESSSTSTSLPAPDEDDGGMAEDMAQQSKLWQVEHEMRSRCAPLTLMELQALQEVSEPLAQRLQEHGLSPGSNTARVWLDQRLADSGQEYVPHHSLGISTREWSLAKIRLLASRKSLPTQFNCYCLPSEAFYPKGCFHKQVPFGISCKKCSSCYRCGKACKKFDLSREESCSCRPAGLVGANDWKH